MIGKLRIMKKIILSLAVLITYLGFSQKEIDTINVGKVNLQLLEKFNRRIDVKVLKMLDGTILKKGSELILGNISGDENNLGVKSKEFSYVSVNKYSVFALMSNVAFSNNQKGTEILIDEIILFKSSATSVIVINFTRKDGADIAMSKFGFISNFEKAINTGEIINPFRAITRDEAIKKLKESKDLLDLGMIKQDEFEKIKIDLTPIIMKKSQM